MAYSRFIKEGNSFSGVAAKSYGRKMLIQ